MPAHQSKFRKRIKKRNKFNIHKTTDHGPTNLIIHDEDDAGIMSHGEEIPVNQDKLFLNEPS